MTSPKTIAALALADVLERVVIQTTSDMPSSHFYGARRNIEIGDELSVDANWRIIDETIGKALPDGYAPQHIKDAI